MAKGSILECYCLKKRKNIPARKNPTSKLRPGSMWGTCVCAIIPKKGEGKWFLVDTNKLYPIDNKKIYDKVARGIKQYS